MWVQINVYHLLSKTHLFYRSEKINLNESCLFHISSTLSQIQYFIKKFYLRWSPTSFLPQFMWEFKLEFIVSSKSPIPKLNKSFSTFDLTIDLLCSAVTILTLDMNHEKEYKEEKGSDLPIAYCRGFFHIIYYYYDS